MTFSTFSSASQFLQPSASAAVPLSGCEGRAMFDLILGLAVAAGLFVYLVQRCCGRSGSKGAASWPRCATPADAIAPQTG